jgi:hypothetical protein
VNTATRVRYLRIVLVLVGLIFILGVYPLMMAWWPSGFSPSQGSALPSPANTEKARGVDVMECSHPVIQTSQRTNLFLTFVIHLYTRRAKSDQGV